MDELGFDFHQAIEWFEHNQDQPFVLVKLNAEQAAQFMAELASSVRRCYITDDQLVSSATTHGLPQAEILATKLPDQGSTMAGDFGEILCYFYQSTTQLPNLAIGVKKWRLKQDRTKPAPRSDVIHFMMPNRPHPSEADVLLCCETKLKSTSSVSTPIASAIADCTKDRTTRLAQTLVWLRERALTENLGDVDVPLLNRFINLVDYPEISKKFHAVAVICTSLIDAEILTAPAEESTDHTLIILTVPDLKNMYESVYAAVMETVPL